MSEIGLTLFLCIFQPPGWATICPEVSTFFLEEDSQTQRHSGPKGRIWTIFQANIDIYGKKSSSRCNNEPHMGTNKASLQPEY